MSILDRLKKSKATDTAEPAKEAPVKVEAKATKPAAKKAATDVSVKASANAANTLRKGIILKPVITEKASMSGTYQFMVAQDTNRVEVAKAFTALYNKVPRKVNIITVRGKSVRFGRMKGQRSNWKKAVVYLKKGETIDLYA